MEAIYLSWFIISIGFHFMSQKQEIKKIYLAHKQLIAIIAVMFSISILFNLATIFYGGYFIESLQFYKNYLGTWFLPFAMTTFCAVFLPIINFYRKFRDKKIIQNLILIVILLFLIIRFLVLGFQTTGFSTSVIPGWHTTIYENIVGIEMTPIILLIIVLADIIIASINKNSGSTFR